ncbi:methyl-accepting chemotaxis protein [Caldimonas sp. KR1-144]|uniref:methyl-accepting chemotaxis protein n=1 Tax=Caldimonas sp. KR1-144 TaxID=3400911 RepID=UPI003C007C49
MRLNHPVTQREYEIPEGVTLVSTTDLDSYITYCNPAFIEVSGYAKDELIGQPHNLVRHPDMPPEAFRDMWETLRAGQPWSALVKNRRKNGDHYWVVANVTPVVKDGRPVGYMSVRTKPTREQIAAAEALYARMRQEAAEKNLRTRLLRGELRPVGLARVTATLSRAAGWTLGAAAGLATGAVAMLLPSSPVLTVLAGMGFGAAAVAFSRARLLARADELVTVANRIAAGDLTQKVDVDAYGEFKRLAKALSQVSVNLRAIVSDVRAEVAGVNHAVEQIALGNKDLSSRTESQASSLQQTAASMQQMTEAVKQSADNSAQANQLAASAASAAGRGGEVVGRVVSTMDDISQSSRKIADIIGVIDGIAFQTNILALNAAVEAARAGEQGRGFAVVAGEVRNLAQRSAGAAKEIKTLIETSVDNVASGARLVNDAGAAMTDIVGQVKRVTDLIAEISASAKEQSLGIGQVNQAMTTLDDGTQQNAALVEESGSAAESLRQQAHRLTEVVSAFHV